VVQSVNILLPYEIHKSVCFNSILLLKIDLNQKLFRVGKTNFRHFSHQILWLDRN